MMIKKIFFIVLLGVTLGWNASAARLVPDNNPLQPMPVDTAPNVSNNINSKDSEINQNLESQIPVTESEEEELPAGDGEGTVPPPILIRDISEPATTNYWILLFVGLAGLMIVVTWSYIRYVKNSIR